MHFRQERQERRYNKKTYSLIYWIMGIMSVFKGFSVTKTEQRPQKTLFLARSQREKPFTFGISLSRSPMHKKCMVNTIFLFPLFQNLLYDDYMTNSKQPKILKFIFYSRACCIKNICCIMKIEHIEHYIIQMFSKL